jgi:hypothetical protein
MNLKDIANIRLTSQQIAETKFKTAKDIVGWMGAMQAQDYAMAKWAIGVRLPKSTDNLIETAIDKGEIIRTHLLRPTWHFVLAKDIYWMIDLTAPQIKAKLKSRHKELELTQPIITKSNKVIEKVLMGGKHLTREELINELKKAKIATDNNRSTHLILEAELEKIICNGATKSRKQTYTLLCERVPKTKTLLKEEALSKLAKRYFTSHSPATLQDFVWWSGLLVSDAKNALEMIKSDFISETIGSQTYWLTSSFSIPNTDKVAVYLLPAFDEFLISYRDRSASFSLGKHKKPASENGIFRPVIVVNGQITGLWSRIIKKDKVIVEPKFFQRHNKTIKNFVENEAKRFGYFLDKKAEVNYHLN